MVAGVDRSAGISESGGIGGVTTGVLETIGVALTLGSGDGAETDPAGTLATAAGGADAAGVSRRCLIGSPGFDRNS
jgi:hypothetical protein